MRAHEHDDADASGEAGVRSCGSSLEAARMGESSPCGLSAQEREAARERACTLLAAREKAAKERGAAWRNDMASMHEAAASAASAFLRAETEDDDGYDPYSDRPAPICGPEEDPWR